MGSKIKLADVRDKQGVNRRRAWQTVAGHKFRYPNCWQICTSAAPSTLFQEPFLVIRGVSPCLNVYQNFWRNSFQTWNKIILPCYPPLKAVDPNLSLENIIVHFILKLIQRLRIYSANKNRRENIKRKTRMDLPPPPVLCIAFIVLPYSGESNIIGIFLYPTDRLCWHPPVADPQSKVLSNSTNY